MQRSVVKDIEIKHILKKALTSNVDDRELFMKGIDVSYYYEGYTTYKIEELQMINDVEFDNWNKVKKITNNEKVYFTQPKKGWSPLSGNCKSIIIQKV